MYNSFQVYFFLLYGSRRTPFWNLFLNKNSWWYFCNRSHQNATIAHLPNVGKFLEHPILLISFIRTWWSIHHYQYFCLRNSSVKFLTKIANKTKKNRTHRKRPSLHLRISLMKFVNPLMLDMASSLPQTDNRDEAKKTKRHQRRSKKYKWKKLLAAAHPQKEAIDRFSCY